MEEELHQKRTFSEITRAWGNTKRGRATLEDLVDRAVTRLKMIEQLGRMKYLRKCSKSVEIGWGSLLLGIYNRALEEVNVPQAG